MQTNPLTISDELTEIVRNVFETMMGLEVAAAGVPWFHHPERLTAAVQLSGVWSGAVLLECDRTLACRLAAAFLSMPEPAEVDDMVRDVIGELTNMIGGNLKCTLSDGIQLSTPVVVDGSSLSLRVCGAEVCQRVALACDGGLLWVTVVSVGSIELPHR
jgi:chemotaxis protein CheX